MTGSQVYLDINGSSLFLLTHFCDFSPVEGLINFKLINFPYTALKINFHFNTIVNYPETGLSLQPNPYICCVALHTCTTSSSLVGPNCISCCLPRRMHPRKVTSSWHPLGQGDRPCRVKDRDLRAGRAGVKSRLWNKPYIQEILEPQVCHASSGNDNFFSALMSGL